MGVLSALPKQIGLRTVQENLEEIALVALDDYYYSMPMMSSIFAEPSLLKRQRDGFVERNEGPHRANEAIESYLYE